MTDGLSIGRRVAWYRRRRGMPQEVLADMVERTVDWLSKVENDRIQLDRLSVIARLAQALDVTVGDLVGEPSMSSPAAESDIRTVPALRDVLLDYGHLAPPPGIQPAAGPASLDSLRRELAAVMDAYQASRYETTTARLPDLIRASHVAVETSPDHDLPAAHAVLALSYQAAAAILTKLGEGDLAWIAAERGLTAARQSDSTIVMGSLFRSVAHTLLATGRLRHALRLTDEAAASLQPQLGTASPEYLSVYGMLFLSGAMAASRLADAGTTRAFLQEAEESARRLGRDANHLWTAFGPTNVAIHRAATAMELGDFQSAIQLSAGLDLSALPVERRVRHALDVARAYTARRHTDEAVAVVLGAERLAPEQVRYHAMSRQLVLHWLRQVRSRPGRHLAGLARRMRLVA
jgi:transcriptional regulator with XRE-family HTH domain